MPSDIRYRNACVTSWSDEVVFDETCVKYIIYHREICPDTKKLHYHIYVEFKNKVTIKKVKEIFKDNTIHIEPRHGTSKQAIDYVVKDTNEFEVVEYGTRKKSGERNDIKSAVNMIKENKKNIDIINDMPIVFVKFHRGLEKTRFEINKVKANTFRILKNYVITGPAGCGKTRYVYDLYGYDNVYKLDAGTSVWFDGYDGQEILLIDDFYGWIKYGHLLNILDGYPLRLDIKGGHTWALWNKVFITSNDIPALWYQKGLTPALERRITKIELIE